MRIAYDILFAAFNYLKSNRKTGFYRVIEEVLLALNVRNDVDVTAVSVCHDNPVLLQILSKGYLKQQKTCIASGMLKHYEAELVAQHG